MAYRSTKRYVAEEFLDDMNNPLVRVKGEDDNMVYTIVNSSDFANMYEEIPE